MFDLFSDFFDSFGMYPVYYEEKACPKCGMTYSKLQKSGKIGCAECYNVFRKPIIETVKQIQPNAAHAGKIPSRCAGELKLKRRYEELKREIAAAVAQEDYEKAAKLHRELKEMGGEA